LAKVGGKFKKRKIKERTTPRPAKRETTKQNGKVKNIETNFVTILENYETTLFVKSERTKTK
jgi:hypothetical protein